MVIGERRQNIVCFAGRDDDSIVALARARAWKEAWGWSVRAVFLTSSGMPPSRTPDASWFQCWAASKAALPLAMRDIQVCSADEMSETFDRAASASTGLIVCPASADASTEVGSISLSMMWRCAARLRVPLFVARRDVLPRRVLVVTDGTARTLPVLELAFELGEHMSASLSYLDTLRIPIVNARQPLRAKEALGLRAIVCSLAQVSTAGSAATRYALAAHGLLANMTRAGVGEQADILVVGIPPADHGAAEEIIRAAPCSVLAVPCP
jgi:nucleotide-binding universal stress UspA family protein